MPQRTQFVPNAPIPEQLEHLRQGTFEKFESGWELINSTETHTFTHGLDDVPVVVDVIRSDVQNGDNPRDAMSNVTITKSGREITVRNNVTVAINGKIHFYFKVRAF